MERTAFHFASFVVSRARRQLLRDGCAVPLVPRYFDLLLLLIERRGEAVHRRELEQRRNAALALATLRDARWNVAGAAPVPFLGHTGMWRSGFALARLRLGELWSLARRRWAAAVLGGMAAGAVAGALGGSALWLGPGATGTAAVVLVLAILGAAIGGLGAAGVAAGLTLCEVTFRAARAPALLAGAICALTTGLLAWNGSFLAGRSSSRCGTG